MAKLRIIEASRDKIETQFGQECSDWEGKKENVSSSHTKNHSRKMSLSTHGSREM